MNRVKYFAKPPWPLLLLLCWALLPACQSGVERGGKAEAQAAAPTLPPPSAEGPLDPNRPPEAAAPSAMLPPGGAPPKDLRHETRQNPDGTWGYDIFGDGKLLLHQPHIPALPGNAGFQTEAQATRVAQAALQKIKNGESLPTLSVEEVRGLMTN